MSEPKIRLTQISPSATGTDSISGNVTITNDLTVGGNLTVSGDTTTLNVQTLLVEDNEIILNSNVTESPSLNASVTVNRGSSSNAFLLWNEGTDKWGWSDDGNTVTEFATAVLKTGDTMTGQLNISSGGLLVTGNVGIGTSSPEGLISFPATASNTPKFRLQSATTNTDVAISSYADASGTYVSFGANHYFDSNGNDAVFETTDRSAYIALDARNSGAIVFGTNSSGIAAARARIDSSGNFLVGSISANPIIATGGRGYIEVNGTTDSAIGFESNGTLGGYLYNSATEFRVANYSNNALTFHANNIERMRITSGGNVGIGTSSPSAPLDVVSSSGAVGQYIRGRSSDNIGSLYFTSNSSVATEYGYVQGRSTDLRIQGFNNGLILQPASGNVGIGTSSPTHKLQVNGSGRFGSMTTGPGLLNGSSDTFQIGLNQDNTNTSNTQVWAEYVNGASSASWAIRYRIANDTGTAITRLYLDAVSGNLGIATTSPGSLLSVGSGATAIYGGGTSNESIVHINGAGPSNDVVRGQITLSDTKAYNASPLFIASFAGKYNSSSNYTFFSGIGGGKENTTDGNYAGYLAFYSRPHGGTNTERARITSGGLLGVGLTDPQSPIEVQSDSGGTGIRIRGRSTANTGTLRFYTNNGTTQQAKFEANDTNVEVGSITNVPLVLYANGSERARLDASGNLILGSGGLDVSGTGGTPTAFNIRAGSGYAMVYGQTTATTTNSSAVQLVGATSGASAGGAAELLGIIQVAAESDSSTNATGYINFYTGSGGSVTERMRITSAGNVGIGTTSPSVNGIDIVRSGGTSTYVRTSDGTYTMFCGVAPALGGGLVGTISNSPLILYANNAERARITSGGALCIGTTSVTAGGFDSATSCVIQNQTSGGECLGLRSTSQSGTNLEMVVFRDGNNTQIGVITGNAAADTTNYGTSSDYRLKENVVEINQPIEKLKKLKPRTFNMISNPNNKLDGFLAHELAEVIPNATCGEKDAVNADGSIKPQQVDYGLVTPLLTAALQEAISKIEILEAELAALKEVK